MNLPAMILATGGSFLFLCWSSTRWSGPSRQRANGSSARSGGPISASSSASTCSGAGWCCGLLTHFADWIDGDPAGFRAAVADQPWWLQAVEVILLSDFFVYWGHRLQHRIPFLWRFHSIHHSAEHLDWLAAHREHPLDTVYTMGLINLPAFLLGFPLETLAGLIAFRGIWAIYIHSNVRLPIGPLRWFVGAPELHHWHHDRASDAGNYANISPLMDLAFGTYRCPDHEPEAFGIHEPIPRELPRTDAASLPPSWTAVTGEVIAALLNERERKRFSRRDAEARRVLDYDLENPLLAATTGSAQSGI